MAIRLAGCLSLALGLAIAGCGGNGGPGTTGPRPTVVVYSALDREFAEPVLDAYAKKTGVDVRPKFDVESTKTVGLTQAIVAERARPVCDLFWNNEILNTLRLREKGLLEPFTPSHAAELPDAFRATDGTWYGFAARARILLVNTKLVPGAERPAGIRDLLDPKWKGKVAIAKPLFGTTATHATCLFAAWGDADARQYFKDLKANSVQVLSGNRDVARAVGNGTALFGLTDTDDAMAELAEGSPVAIIYPDREPDQLGTLFIPNTLAIVKGAPHAEAARALADHLLSPAVESALAEGEGAQIPLLKTSRAASRVETPRTVHAMAADFEAAVRLWDEVARFLAEEFAGG